MGKKRKRKKKDWSQLSEATKKKIYFARKKRLEKKQKAAGDKRVGAFERDMLARIGGHAQIAKVSNKKVSEEFTAETNARVADTKARLAKMLEKDKNRTPEEIKRAEERNKKSLLNKSRRSQIYGVD